jgi:hypothetical protein
MEPHMVPYTVPCKVPYKVPYMVPYMVSYPPPCLLGTLGVSGLMFLVLLCSLCNLLKGLTPQAGFSLAAPCGTVSQQIWDAYSDALFVTLKRTKKVARDDQGDPKGSKKLPK